MSKFIDLTGRRFGRLEVIKRVENNKHGNLRWLCKCNCKNEIIAVGNDLKRGYIKSCGCLVTKHGHARRGKSDGFYRSWHDMKQRCTNPENKQYKNYGGRGIAVGDRWLHSFVNFLEDMTKGWKPGLTLERIENELGYYKDNCRWATMGQQNKNKRNNNYATYKGKRWFFVELCKKHNIPRDVVYNRYYILGWTIEKALMTPVRKRRKKS